jgi:hypothetical protein
VSGFILLFDLFGQIPLVTTDGQALFAPLRPAPTAVLALCVLISVALLVAAVRIRRLRLVAGPGAVGYLLLGWYLHEVGGLLRLMAS